MKAKTLNRKQATGRRNRLERLSNAPDAIRSANIPLGPDNVLSSGSPSRDGGRFGKRGLLAQTFLAGATGVAFLVFAQSSPVLAGPEGATVVSGSVVIKGEGTKAVTIEQASQRAIIDWRGYSINVDESVTYRQPGATSISLNRVTGGDPSHILGALSANGQVWLVNPAGIVFGASARVDVAGLVATTTNISNRDFIAGVYNFDEATENRGAVVINKGDITVSDGGMLAFVAPGVSNNGSITAKMGRVALASGDAFAFDLYGDALVHLTASAEEIGTLAAADGSSLAARLVQDGTIAADGGRVQLSVQSARSLVDNSINMSGYVRARTVSEQGGAIVLSGGDAGTVAVSGTLDASARDAGASGGSVKVLGNRVGLFDEARIDVSGDAGGGEVLIGGNLRGQGPEQNASATYFGADVRVTADAVSDGDGGRVIVWSDDYTRFDGSISARGGLEGGNGGFVETSSKDNLQAFGSVDAAAPAGSGGQWLLDPRNVNITNADVGGGFGGGDPDVFTPIADNATINAATIVGALNAGTSVTITTTDAGGAQDGNITVSNAIAANLGAGAETLTLSAEGSITVNADITAAGAALDLVLNSDVDGANSGGVINIGANISLNGGNLTADTTTSTVTGNFAITQSGGTITANNVTFNTEGVVTTGAIAAAGTLAITASDIVIGNSIIAASASISTSGGEAIGLGGTAAGFDISGVELQRLTANSATLSTTGSITVNGISAANSDNVTSLTLDASGTIAFSTAASTFNGLTVQSDTDIDVNVDVTTDLGALSFDADANNAGGAGADTLDIAAGVTLASAAGLTLDATTGGVAFAGVGTLNAVNGVTINDAVTATAGTLTINADTDANGTGVFTNNAAITANGQNVAITAGDAVINNTITADTIVLGATNGRDIDYGNTLGLVGSNDFDLSSAEVGRLAETTRIELDTTGNVLVDINLSESALDIDAAAVNFAGTVTTTVGGITVSNSGAATLNGAMVSAGAVSFDGAGGVALNAGITATGNNITFGANEAVTVGAGAPIALSTGGGAGNVSFGNVLTLTAGGANDLTITAGSGTVTFTGLATINDNDLTVSSSTITTVTAGISGSTGAVDFTTSTRADVDGNIALTGSGTVTLDAATITSADITTQGGAIAFSGAVIYDADTPQSVKTDVGDTGSGADITFGSSLALNGAGNGDLTIDAGDQAGDDVTFTGAVTIGADDLTVAGSGTTVVTAGISGSTGAIDFTTTTRTDVDGAIALSGVGTVTLDAATISGVNVTTAAGAIGFSGAVNLDTAAVAVSTGGGAGTITFGSTVDGGQSLTLPAGLGNVDFDGAVGFTTDLGAVLVNSAANVTADLTFEASSFTQSAGSGTTTFTGLVTTGGVFDFNGSALTLNGGLTTTGGGNVSVTNSGTATVASTITSAGTVTFDSTGAITLGANIVSTGLVSVSGSAVTLTGDRSISTTNADITLDEVLTNTNNDHVLTLTAGAGNIVIDDNLGVNGGNVLGGLTIVSAADVTLSSDDATADLGSSGLTVTSATGDVEFDAAVNSAGAIDINTATLTLDAAMTTTGGSSITITNTGTAALNALVTSAGTTTFDGAGGITLGANIVSTGLVLIQDSALTLTGNRSITTTNDNITLDEVLTDTNDDHVLTLTAGSGNIVINDNVGVAGGNVLAGLNIVSAGIVNFDTGSATLDIGGQQLRIGSGSAVTSVAFDGDVNAKSSVTVSANDGIVSTGAITLDAGTLTLDADVDANDNVGTLQLVQQVSNLGRAVDIDANDLDLSANLIAGSLTLTDSDGNGIGLGSTAVAGGLNVSGAELQRMSISGSAEFETGGAVTVNGISVRTATTSPR